MRGVGVSARYGFGAFNTLSLLLAPTNKNAVLTSGIASASRAAADMLEINVTRPLRSGAGPAALSARTRARPEAPSPNKITDP